MNKDNNKKIGLLNFYFSDNYGAVLQAYALLMALKRIKANVEIVNLIPKLIHQKYSVISNPISLIKQKGLVKGIMSFLLTFKSIIFRIKRKRVFNNFRKKHLTISKKRYTSNIKEMLNDYVGIIIGSDQVWNPKIIKGHEDIYFLSQLRHQDLVIASYAASYGENTQSELQLRSLLDNISHFDYISVREHSLADNLRRLSESKQIFCHLDSAFLISSEEYLAIADTISFNGNYILVYDMNQSRELTQYVNKLAVKTDLEVISFSNGKKYFNSKGTFAKYSPTQFITLIHEANYVISSSFHGVVFSIIFEKKFIAFPDGHRGHRISDLLKTMNLSNRDCSFDYSVEIDIDNSIDYIRTKEIIAENRILALSYLRDTFRTSK